MTPVIDKIKTGKQIYLLMKQQGITVKDVCSALSLSSVQSVYHWICGKTMPTIDNLYALSDLLQVPIDLLVCGNRKRSARIEDRLSTLPDKYRLLWYYTEFHCLSAV